MTATPFVSIIIPTYNRLWALTKAVDSCFSEGCKVEVVVIDDGSTDGTAELLGWKDYARVHAASVVRAVIERGR